MTSLDKRLLWIQPYLKAVANDINLSKLKAIKGYYVINKIPSQDGQTIRTKNKYVITIKLNRTNINEPNFLYEFLHTLAHELAHLKYWSHCGKHMELTAKLFCKFAIVVKNQGIQNTYKRIEINE